MTDLFLLASTSFSFKLAGYGLWLVPTAYAMAFFCHWLLPERVRSLSFLAAWIHIGVWFFYSWLAPTSAPVVSAGWGMLALSLVAAPLLLDRQQHFSTWLHTNLLLALFTALLWIFLATSQIPTTPTSPLEMFSWFLLFAGVGVFLSHSMMAWQMSTSETSPSAPQIIILHRTLLLASLLSTLSLTLLLFQGWRLSFLHVGNLLICFLSYGSLLFPTLVPEHPTTGSSLALRLSPAFLGWSKIGGSVVLVWLFVQLILLA